MIPDIAPLLWRNQGATLTPELIEGLLLGIDRVAADAGLCARVRA